jgi:hypothetical protein
MAALRAWVIAPTDVPDVRDELLVKTSAFWLVDRAQAAAMLREHERQHIVQLDVYEQIRDHLHARWVAQGKTLDAPLLGGYLTVQRGIRYEREYADWCRWAADLLDGKIDG